MSELGIEGCDAGAFASVYMYPDGIMRCRCMVCARCEHHAPSMYGHYTGFCKNNPWGSGEPKHHFCCPDDCELENE